MVIRELLAVFGIQYDPTGERKMRKSTDRMREDLEFLGSAVSNIFQTAALVAPAAAIVKLGSAARENNNVMQVAFEESAESVKDWARTASKELGRSRYELEQTAARLGVFLRPMLGSAEGAAEMSKSLATLAEDLTSLMDLRPEEALTAFRSALSGETETIKRFGVDMSALAQQQEAVRMGYGKNVRELTKAQKAQIRYNILIRDLAVAEGDAARTRNDFANSFREFQGQLKDIGTELGLFLLPALEDVLITLKSIADPIRNAAEEFRNMAARSEAAKAALLVLGGLIAVLIGPMLVKLALMASVFGLAVLAVDTFLTRLKGGHTILDDFNTWLDSLKEPEFFNNVSSTLQFWITAVQTLRKGFDLLLDVIVSWFGGILTGDFFPMMETLKEIMTIYKDIKSSGIAGLAKHIGMGDTSLTHETPAALSTVPGAGTVLAPPGTGTVLNDNSSNQVELIIQAQPHQSPQEIGVHTAKEVAKVLRREALQNQLLAQGIEAPLP